MVRNLRFLYKRVQNGYTQLKLAKELNAMGDKCTQEEISKYEKGEITPRIQRAINIAKILKCEVYDIF